MILISRKHSSIYEEKTGGIHLDLRAGGGEREGDVIQTHIHTQKKQKTQGNWGNTGSTRKKNTVTARAMTVKVFAYFFGETFHLG